jgi:hypothetical protein
LRVAATPKRKPRRRLGGTGDGVSRPSGIGLDGEGRERNAPRHQKFRQSSAQPIFFLDGRRSRRQTAPPSPTMVRWRRLEPRTITPPSTTNASQSGSVLVSQKSKSDTILEFYRLAAEARRMADVTRSPRQKADLLEVEDRWLSLARSQELWSGMRGEVKRAS